MDTIAITAAKKTYVIHFTANRSGQMDHRLPSYRSSSKTSQLFPRYGTSTSREMGSAALVAVWALFSNIDANDDVERWAIRIYSLYLLMVLGHTRRPNCAIDA